jgi:hypothetical protein
MLLASNPWHFWIAVVLVIFAVVPAVLGVGLGYLWFVSRSRYPRPKK